MESFPQNSDFKPENDMNEAKKEKPGFFQRISKGARILAAGAMMSGAAAAESGAEEAENPHGSDTEQVEDKTEEKFKEFREWAEGLKVPGLTIERFGIGPRVWRPGVCINDNYLGYVQGPLDTWNKETFLEEVRSILAKNDSSSEESAAPEEGSVSSEASVEAEPETKINFPEDPRFMFYLRYAGVRLSKDGKKLLCENDKLELQEIELSKPEYEKVDVNYEGATSTLVLRITLRDGKGTEVKRIHFSKGITTEKE